MATADKVPLADISFDIREKLLSVDWNFEDNGTRNGIHNIHPYPARFIPQIPRELIRLFHPGDDSAVLDPFCGSGTTLVEAIMAGKPAIGIDVNPLSILISKVKTTPPTRNLSLLAAQVVAQAKREAATIPSIPRLNHWFLPDVQQALARILSQLERIDDPTARDALKVALSRIMVRVSNQESDTRYASVKKDVDAQLVYDLFLKSAELVDKALTDTYFGLFAPNPRCTLLNRNILEVQPDEIGRRVGLVVTSPPYPNAYEYWLYHKYRMYWLGMDPIAVRQQEIGARPHYFKKNPQTEVDFERQMSQCFSLLSRVMLPNSLACFLIGRSVIHGKTIDNVALLERAAAPHGFRRVAQVERRIPSKRKSFNPTNSAINEEWIVIFCLEGKTG